MSNQIEIRLSGSGGQGLILGGIILAEAALLDGKNAIQSQSYGPEARGGASKAEVIISDNEINYPKVRNCEILLSLTQASCDKYLDSLRTDGVLIIDREVNMTSRKDIKVFRIPILRTASEELNKPMVANIIALGALFQLSKVVSKESLKKAVMNRVPKGTEEFNVKALSKGFELIEKYEE